MIPRLAAHGRIEGCLLHKDRSHFTVRQSVHDLTFRCHHRDLRLEFQPVIAHKLCCHRRIYGFIDRGVSAHIVCFPAGSSGFLLLLFHAALKALFRHRKTLFLQDLLRQIKGEAKGIIKPEGILARQFLFPLSFQFLHHLL